MPEDAPATITGLLRQASPELASALGLLRRLFDIRVTFFDLDGVEADGFEVKPISAYCTARRRDPAFAARCLVCDRRHLDEAKRGRAIRIYRCHDGLVEGVIPLYAHDGAYLGSIMFGQLRPVDDPAGGRPAAMQRLRERLPQADAVRLRDLADLLKWLSEHVATSAASRQPALPWAEAARRHIAAHLGDKLSIAGVARAVGRSPSFLSHHFPQAFGTSFARFVRDQRMQEARRRLSAGETLPQIAEALGFCDRYHLSRVWRRHFGRSPRSA